MATFDNLPKAQRPPPCPEDLTEIAYANLLYDPFCMVRAYVYILFRVAQPYDQDCGERGARAYWMARVRVCHTDCIKDWYSLLSNPVFLSPDAIHRVTVVGGVQDQAAVALSHGQLHSSSQVLPTVSVKGQPRSVPRHIPNAHGVDSSAPSQTDACVHARLETAHSGPGSGRRPRNCGSTIQRRIRCES